MRRGELRSLFLEEPYGFEIYVRDELFADIFENLKPYKRDGTYKLVFEINSAEKGLKLIKATAVIGYEICALREKLR